MSTVKVEEIQNPSNSNNAVSIASDSSVSLKHSGSAKLTTTATGVSVTGTCAATAYTGDGSALTGLPASGITVQDEGSALSTAATTLDFVGAGVTASGTGASKTITISGAGGALEFVSKTTISSSANYFDITGLDADSVYLFIGKEVVLSTANWPEISFLDASSGNMTCTYTRSATYGSGGGGTVGTYVNYPTTRSNTWPGQDATEHSFTMKVGTSPNNCFYMWDSVAISSGTSPVMGYCVTRELYLLLVLLIEYMELDFMQVVDLLELLIHQQKSYFTNTRRANESICKWCIN